MGTKRSGDPKKPRGPVPLSRLLPTALASLGVPSERVTRKVLAAWERVADPAWSGKAAPERLAGGWLVLGVSSSALREELTQFHRERLLKVLQAALPDVPLVGLSFVDAEPPERR